MEERIGIAEFEPVPMDTCYLTLHCHLGSSSSVADTTSGTGSISHPTQPYLYQPLSTGSR